MGEWGLAVGMVLGFVMALIGVAAGMGFKSKGEGK